MAITAIAAILSSALSSACSHPSAPVEAPMISAEARALGPTTTTAGETKRPRLAANADGPLDRGDRLKGQYFCAQGRTELTLVIEDLDGDDVAAIFEFDYPGGGGTSAPASGSYRMHGSFDANSHALRLDGDRWIEQPDGYVMVGLVGTVSKTGSITGSVKGPGCSTFYVNGPRRPQAPAP